MKRPRVRAVSTPDFRCQGHGFESCWRFIPNLNGALLHKAFHRLDMTEILLGKDVKPQTIHPSIHPSIHHAHRLFVKYR